MSVDRSKAVFLSYASQDADAARSIADALRAAGVEVWFDQNELVGGDAWDAKIRRQIGACALFVPVISAGTQARGEGYFRLEWKLAVDRSHLMAHDQPFLLPVVIDATADAAARVPPEFRAVQWTRLANGETPPAFCARVRNLLSEGGETDAAPLRSAKSHGGVAALEATRAGRGRWLLAVLGLGAVVSAVALVVWQPWKKSAVAFPPAAGGGSATGASATDDKAVAVLPFANVSGDREQEYFSDGLTEEILNALARERDLRVPGRASAFSFKNTKTPTAEIARALNVTRLVEGSVRRSGNHVRITVQLTRAADGFSESLGSFNKELSDGAAIFALQEEVARVVVEKLTRRTTTAAVAVTTTNSAAYDAYLRGRGYMVQTTPFWPKAAEEFQRAVELDPKFALAWASLGRVLATLYSYGFEGAALAPTQHAVDEALRLDPELPEAVLARAALLQGLHAPLDDVARALDRAEQRRPNDSDILAQRASLEGARARADAEIKLLQRAVELDPRNGGKLNTLGNAYADGGRYAEAEATYRQAFQLLGSSIPVTNRARVYFNWKGDRPLVLRTLDEVPEAARGDRYWYSRGTLLYAVGDFPGALEALAKTRERAEFFRIRPYLTGRVREAMGDPAGARRDYLAALPVAEKQCADFPGVPAPYTTLALVYAGLGRKDEALAAARKSLELVRPAEYLREASGSRSVHLGGFYALAVVQAQFGMNDEALAIVQEQTRTGRWRRNELLLHSDWAVLRKDARFRALAERAPL